MQLLKKITKWISNITKWFSDIIYSNAFINITYPFRNTNMHHYFNY